MFKFICFVNTRNTGFHGAMELILSAAGKLNDLDCTRNLMLPQLSMVTDTNLIVYECILLHYEYMCTFK